MNLYPLTCQSPALSVVLPLVPGCSWLEWGVCGLGDPLGLITESKRLSTSTFCPYGQSWVESRSFSLCTTWSPWYISPTRSGSQKSTCIVSVSVSVSPSAPSLSVGLKECRRQWRKDRVGLLGWCTWAPNQVLSALTRLVPFCSNHNAF